LPLEKAWYGARKLVFDDRVKSWYDSPAIGTENRFRFSRARSLHKVGSTGGQPISLQCDVFCSKALYSQLGFQHPEQADADSGI
jgi:hypothetical protein